MTFIFSRVSLAWTKVIVRFPRAVAVLSLVPSLVAAYFLFGQQSFPLEPDLSLSQFRSVFSCLLQLPLCAGLSSLSLIVLHDCSRVIGDRDTHNQDTYLVATQFSSSNLGIPELQRAAFSLPQSANDVFSLELGSVADDADTFPARVIAGNNVPEYQNRRAHHLLLVYKAENGNMIDREKLTVVHELESKLRSLPEFLNICYSTYQTSGHPPQCAIPDSFINFIYPSVSDSDPPDELPADPFEIGGTLVFDGLGQSMVTDPDQAVQLLLMAERGGFFDQSAS